MNSYKHNIKEVIMLNQLISIPKGYLISIDRQSDGEWTSMIMKSNYQGVDYVRDDKDEPDCVASNGHRSPGAAMRAVLKKWNKFHKK